MPLLVSRGARSDCKRTDSRGIEMGSNPLGRDERGGMSVVRRHRRTPFSEAPPQLPVAGLVIVDAGARAELHQQEGTTAGWGDQMVEPVGPFARRAARSRTGRWICRSSSAKPKSSDQPAAACRRPTVFVPYSCGAGDSLPAAGTARGRSSRTRAGGTPPGRWRAGRASSAAGRPCSSPA